MKKLILNVTLLMFIAFAAVTVKAQTNKLRFDDPKENFYDTQKRLNKKFKKFEKELANERKEKAEGHVQVGQEEEMEMEGYELYKRWEFYAAPRVYPSGDKTLASRSHALEEYQKYISQNAQQRQNLNSVTSATWQPVGPFGDPTGGNAGRVNAVRFDPVNTTNGVWACTPDGGLWSSANNGGSWSTNTDLLTVIGNADVVFDPTNAQTMYMATGDGDATDSYSIGILKSTNSGSTWSATGLTWTVSQGHRIYKMLINPQNKNVLFAATTNGLYRTTNAGTSWNVVQAGSFTDIEYKPGDTTTVYGVTKSFFRSTNGGATFSATSTGLPSSGSVGRLAIAVTAANTAYVYVVASNATDDGFLGFYQSTNSGGAFTSKATSPNLLGWDSAGGDTGGQGWYTLSCAASPTNANEVVVGGVNIWRTTNGGSAWTIFAHWTGTGAPYAHADVHDLIYKNGTTVYAGTDGGVFYTNNSGTSWNAINGNMNIAEIYKIGLSAGNPNLAITGHQDNGTNLFGGGWGQTMGGDGMDCFIDWSNDQVMYGSQYSGSLNRSTSGGGGWTGITSGLTGNGGWVTPWHQDPITANTIYCGYQQMFKSTNQGTAWTQIGTMGGTSQVVEFAIAKSNPQVIYVIQGNTLYKTVNGGTNWTNVTGTIPTGSAQMKWVTVEDDDPNSVWIALSGYSSGNKVYSSSNGGTSWTNYSTGLPNLPTNCITYWNGTKDGLYLGCDVGIYYRDSTMASWMTYNAGLPNVSVSDLAIYYPLGKIRAATFGRGVWEADLYNNGTMAPLANFVADKTFICAGMTVNYTDQSTFAPTSWSWAFQNGAPATSTQQNPSVVYNTPGTYSVSMTATNGNGNNTMTKTLYITVSPINTLPLSEGFQLATFPPANWQNYDAVNDNLVWMRNSSVGRNSTASMYYDNYNLNAGGSRDEMRTPKYDLSTFNQVKLYFDVAYAQYDLTYTDTLAVVVSTDCGLTFTQAYVKGGTTLATAPNLTTATFTPTASQWRTDTVYLNTYAGMSNVMVAFQNRGHYGQALYVDNINITGSNSGTVPNAVFTSSATKCVGQNITFTDQSTGGPTSWSWSFPGGTPSSSTAQNPVITYASAGSYTVTLTSTNNIGSSTPTTQTLTISATPTVTISASSAAVCLGNNTVLTAGGATSYTWSPGFSTSVTHTVTPLSTTTYTLTGNTGGCKNMSTITVTVNPLPTLTITTTGDTICPGNSTTINVNGSATSYSWSPASGLSGTSGSSVTANPTVTTQYSVTGTDANNCSKTVTHNIVVTSCVGISSNSINNSIGVYPNPNHGSFIIEIPAGGTGAYIIEIHNTLGQLIYSDKIISTGSLQKKNILLPSEAKGVYTLEVQSVQGKLIRKIIVE